MKTTFLLTFASIWMAAPAFAEQPVYVCGKEYTNTITAAQAAERKCKLFSGGGNVSIVQSQKPGLRIASATPNPPAATAGPRIDNADQRYKDSESRLILESELKKAEAKQNVLKSPSNASLNQKIKDMRQELKELKNALSNYLQQYQKIADTDQIESEDGEVRQIVYNAHLIKLSSKFSR